MINFTQKYRCGSKRNGTVYYTKILPPTLLRGTTTTKQVIRWNLSDLLTNGIPGR